MGKVVGESRRGGRKTRCPVRRGELGKEGMGVGLRPTGKPVDMLPDPITAAPRVYSTDRFNFLSFFSFTDK
jgi:hypothetical protein